MSIDDENKNVEVSSSDESGNDLNLKEAIATDFINDGMFKSKELTPKRSRNFEHKLSLPSLRRNTSIEDDSYNFFKVTPEFQAHIAKHLSTRLEKQLTDDLTDDVTNSVTVLSESESDNNKTNTSTTAVKRTKKKFRNHIRLLHQSETYLKSGKSAVVEVKPIRKRILTLDRGLHKRQCEEAAIDVRRIQEETAVWSKRSKADVFEYKHVSGKLILKEKPFV